MRSEREEGDELLDELEQLRRIASEVKISSDCGKDTGEFSSPDPSRDGFQDFTGPDNATAINGEFILADLVDVGRLGELLEKFSKVTGLATALVCFPTQEVLLETGCKVKIVEGSTVYRESVGDTSPGDSGIRKESGDREPPSQKQLGNGMPMHMTPVIVDGKRLGGLLACQCPHLVSDPGPIPEHAESFETRSYDHLDVTGRQGIVSRSEVEAALSFLGELAEMIAQQGLTALRLKQRTRELGRAIAEQQRAQEALRNAMTEFERHVEKRAHELTRTNEQLKRETEERKRIQKAWTQSERRYRTLFETARDAIMIMDLEGDNAGRIVDANQIAAETHGYELEEFLTLRIHDLDTPESAEKIPERTRRVLSGEWLREEATHRRKDGGVFPVEISAAMVELENHRYALSIDRDITERKRNEDALRESEARFRALSDAAFESIFLFENDICMGQNAAAEKMFGYSTEEALGRRGTEWIAAESRQIVLDNMLSGDEGTYEAVALRKNGTTFPCEIQGKMIHHEGRTVRVTALRDITDRKEAAALLVQAERRKAIADLVSGVAHNFRNWLQVIVGATRVALQDVQRQAYDQLEVALNKAMTAAQAGAATLTRLEQFAHIRERVEEIGQTVFDVSRTAQQAVEMTKPWWKSGPQERGITVHLKSNMTNGAWVSGSESEIFELLVNLIGNASEAIKEDGEISVEISLEDDKVVIRVSDTGIGIDSENLNKIFEPFWTTKAGVGTGLGLSTCLSTAKRHRGSICAESHVGSGSTFTVTLPRAQPPAETTESGPYAGTATGLRILVIDDMDLSAELLALQLTRLGHDVVAEVSANEALQHLRTSDFDLVISDLLMPEMSGWEVGKAVERICADRGTAKIPLILVTGAGEGLLDESRIAESGVDAVTEKPVDTNELTRIMQEVIPVA